MINLLPLTEKQKIQSDYHFLVFSAYLIGIFFVLAVAVLSFLPDFFIADIKHQKILAESQTKESIFKQSQEQEMKKTVNDTNAKIIFLKAAPVSNAPMLFREILESRNPGVYITGFSYDANPGPAKKGSTPLPAITLQGTADDRAELLSFVSVLSKNKNFSAVDLPLSNLISDANVSYTLNITIAPFNTK